MEDIPPSYHQSTNPSVLDLVAPYLDTHSLHALTLVSRSYHETFMPHLWGSPASHFVPMEGTSLPGDPTNPYPAVSYDDLVYVALTRFKRVLRKARLSTRQLVHTLFLPPAVSEIYGGPHSTWLREILDGLPNLQSLCVGGLPFFDHHSLIAVDRRRSSEPTDEYETYPLKLLIASKEPNCTSMGLSVFLPRVRHLIYLDLSYTTPARDLNVLSSLSALADLQVLKIKGIGLRDPDAEVLANAIGLRVRLLDVAENLLGDMAVRSLLQACVQHSSTGEHGQNGSSRNTNGANNYSRRHLESWPVSLPPAPDFLSLDTLRSADFDKNLRVQLTHPLTGRLAFEDIPHAGLTHLYITGNPGVTIEGIRSLLNTGRLHVLDAGQIASESLVDKYVRSAIDTGRWAERPGSVRSTGSMSSGKGPGLAGRGYDGDIHFPGAEKLIPVLRQTASKNLTYLRIDHAIITKKFETGVREKSPDASQSTRKPSSSSPAELSGQIGVTQKVEIPGDNHLAVELPTEQIFELDGASVVRAELPGDIIHFAISPPISQKPSETHQLEEIKPIRGEGAYAPEVKVEDQPERQEDEVILDASGFGVRRPQSSHSIVSPMTPASAIDANMRVPPSPLVTKLPTMTASDRRTLIEQLVKARPRPESRQLHPSSLPHLRTLKLTNVPDHVPADSSVTTFLKQFITSCASESHLSLLQAKTNYSLPPGRARLAAELEHAKSLFALQTIVLEVVPAAQSVSGQRDWKHTRHRLNISKSSTGDMDSEALWSAAENDFSFFGEEGEEHDECGIYDHEPGKYFPSNVPDEKFAVLTDEHATSTSGSGSGSGWSNESDGHGFVTTPATSAPTIGPGAAFNSPRQLPLGRNRRSSGEPSRGTPPASPPAAGNKHRFRTTELPGSTAPVTNLSSRLRASSTGVSSSESKPETIVEMLNTVGELSKFRKERKAAYEAEIRKRSRINGVTSAALTSHYQSAADADVYIEGHWKGEIKVIRVNNGVGVSNGTEVRHGSSHHHHHKAGGGRAGAESGRSSGTMRSSTRGSHRTAAREGMVDVYGNYFEKGYLYP